MIPLHNKFRSLAMHTHPFAVSNFSTSDPCKCSKAKGYRVASIVDAASTRAVGRTHTETPCVSESNFTNYIYEDHRFDRMLQLHSSLSDERALVRGCGATLFEKGFAFWELASHVQPAIQAAHTPHSHTPCAVATQQV